MYLPFRALAPCLALSLVLVPVLATITIAGAADGDERARIDTLLDAFHQAAADADRDRYLGFFTPDGVFLGSDDWERWPLPAFTGYVEQRFAGGTGWTYHPRDRHVMFAPGGDIAWFDEILESPRWGRFRGTGVLQRSDGQWGVAHYSFTLLVPNERFEDAAAVALEGFRAREAAGAAGGEP